jgi:heme exporter protein D
MSDFLAMGGYAPFVWGSYGATLLVFAWNLLAPRARRREILRRIRSAGGNGE